MSNEQENVPQQEQPKKKKTVKLKSVHITNFKAIDELSADVSGNHFMVVGKNGRGKTSVAQAISRNAARLDPKEIADLPIRIGAKNAEVKTTFIIDEDGKERNILIEATYRPSGAVVKVIDLANNGELTPPVKTIIKLLGESHDVSVLMDLSPEEQFKEMLKMLGGRISSEAFEKEFDEKYESRKNIKRLVKDDETYLKEIEPSVDVMRDYRTKGMYTEKKPQDQFPEQPDKATILVEKTKAENKNKDIDRWELDRTHTIEYIQQLKMKLAQKEKELDDVNTLLEQSEKVDLSIFDQQEKEFEEKLEQWKQDVKNFNLYNETVDKVSVYRNRQDILESNRSKLSGAEDAIKDLQNKMKNAISELKLEEIVPELAIKNELDETGYKPIWRKGIYYKNWDGNLLPFNVRQVSYGKMVVALCKLSAFLNHEKFNLFNVRAWNELDQESKKELLDFVENNPDLDIQLLIEEVDEKPLGIKIIEKTK